MTTDTTKDRGHPPRGKVAGRATGTEESWGQSVDSCGQRRKLEGGQDKISESCSPRMGKCEFLFTFSIGSAEADTSCEVELNYPAVLFFCKTSFFTAFQEVRSRYLRF